MRISISSAALFLCLMVSACDKAPNLADSDNGNSNTNGSQNTGSNSQFKSYRFNPGSCDTYKRMFKTQRELCYAIQIDELNNDCAETERLAYFTQNCSSFTTFNPEKAREALIHVNGKYVTCTLSEPNLPELLQYTATNDLVMEHTSVRGLVTHSLQDLKVNLRLSLVDVASGRVLRTIQKSWSDESETLTLTAPTVGGSAVLSCLVNLADNPISN